jgi:hypothetical protein
MFYAFCFGKSRIPTGTVFGGHAKSGVPRRSERSGDSLRRGLGMVAGGEAPGGRQTKKLGPKGTAESILSGGER